jgi:2'-5' RNA ligase
MALGVQLDLDPAANHRLDALAERLESLPGLETVHRLGVTHHVSLGIHDGDASLAFDDALACLAKTTAPIGLAFSGIGVFPGEQSVLYLAPVVTPELLELHRSFHAAIDGRSPPVRGHYVRGAWVPHVTLALDVTPQALTQAIDLVREVWEPMTARVEALRLIRFFPVETLALHPLSRA